MTLIERFPPVRRVQQDPEYRYDATRDKWLGDTFQVSWGDNASETGGLETHGGHQMTGSVPYGWVSPYDATLVGYTLQTRGNSTATVQVYIEGSSVLSISHSGFESTATDTDIDIDPGEALSGQVTSGTLTMAYELTLLFQRRKT